MSKKKFHNKRKTINRDFPVEALEAEDYRCGFPLFGDSQREQSRYTGETLTLDLCPLKEILDWTQHQGLQQPDFEKHWAGLLGPRIVNVAHCATARQSPI